MGKTAEELLGVLAQQERDLVFHSFTNEDAYRLGIALKAMADDKGRKLLISIRKNGQTIFRYAMDSIKPINEHWLERKLRTTELFRCASYAVGLEQRLCGETFADSGLDSALYAGIGGCFPVVVCGCGFVGAVAVSGMEQEEDHQAVVDAISIFLGVNTVSVLA